VENDVPAGAIGGMEVRKNFGHCKRAHGGVRFLIFSKGRNVGVLQSYDEKIRILGTGDRRLVREGP